MPIQSQTTHQRPAPAGATPSRRRRRTPAEPTASTSRGPVAHPWSEHVPAGYATRSRASAEASPSQRLRREGVAPDVLDVAPLLGRYRVMELRDVGGFGSVLVCWDVRLQRRVAVKCMPLDVGASSVTIEEGLAEARASSFLQHPNIVTVHDFEVDDDYAYLVMEYVDGVTLAELRQRVEGGVLVFDEVAYVLKCLASALEFAHRNGVLHLDIKPQNVLIDRMGQVKLTDFGMASLASAAGWGGARGGTLGYMPPEQLEGAYVDERSDVFSLAVLVYEELSGRSPFLAQNAEDSLELIVRGATPIQELEPELDPAVARSIMEALSPDSAHREPSIARFATRLLSPPTAGAIAAGEEPAQPLGDPDRGLASLQSLLSQTEGEDGDFDEGAWRGLDPPGRRVPHLASACARAANAATTAAVALLAAPAFGANALATSILAAVLGGLAAIWGPLGGALGLIVGGLGVGAVGIGRFGEAGDPTYLLIAFCVITVGALWWIGFGREGRLSTAAFLAPAAILAPYATPGLAGYAQRPLAALATGAASTALGLAVAGVLAPGSPIPWAAYSTGLVPDAPGFWLLVMLCALGAFLCSLLNRLGSRRLARGLGAPRLLCCLGQLAATSCAAWGAVLAGALENGGIYDAPEAPMLVVLLGFCALMLIVTGLFGPAQDLGTRPAGAGADPGPPGRGRA